MLNCREATERISQAQDRKLSLLESVPLRLHLMMCSGCRNFSQQMPFLRDAMRAFRRWPGDETRK